MTNPITCNLGYLINTCNQLIDKINSQSTSPKKFKPLESKDISLSKIMDWGSEYDLSSITPPNYNMDSWIMLGDYNFYITLQPAFWNVSNLNKDFFHKIKNDLNQSVAALISLPANFLSVSERFSIAIIYPGVINSNNDELLINTTAGYKPVNKKVFFGELNSTDDIEIIINNFLHENDTNTLSKGFFDTPENFKGFSYYSNQEKIKNISSDYKNFKNYKLDEIAEIVSVSSGSKHKDFNNSIYIPNIGPTPCKDSIDRLTLKHQNYFQCRIDPKYALNKYVVNYLNSPIGRLNRHSLFSGEAIKFITKKNISNLEIPIPEQKLQANINEFHSRLHLIKERMKVFEENIILNPLSEEETKKQLDKVAEIFGTLSAPEKVKALVAGGETRTVEFKETYSLCLKTNQKVVGVMESSLKTIAAFLNSDGGDLLIGISDDGEIKGIENELNKFDKDSIDNFLKRFRNNLVKYFGKGIYPLIDQKIVNVDGKIIFQITCIPTSDPVFMDEDKFFVRTNPATDSLTGKKQYEYIENRKKVFVNISKD
jgi:hypothetical protein